MVGCMEPLKGFCHLLFLGSFSEGELNTYVWTSMLTVLL
jgi:hypothetical protein